MFLEIAIYFALIAAALTIIFVVFGIIAECQGKALDTLFVVSVVCWIAFASLAMWHGMCDNYPQFIVCKSVGYQPKESK